MRARRVYRSTEQAILLWIITVVAVALISTAVLTAHDLAPIKQIAAWAFCAIVAWFGVFRLAMSGVFLEEEEIRVVNPFRTRRFPRTEVEGFSLGRWGPFPKIGFACLRDGERVPLFAIEGPNPFTRPRNRSAERLIESLNEALREATSA